MEGREAEGAPFRRAKSKEEDAMSSQPESAVDNSPENFNASFLTIEDLYLAQQVQGADLLGHRLAPVLWMGKDMDTDSPEFARLAERVEGLLRKWIDNGQRVEVVIGSAEKTRLLDPIEALERAANGIEPIESSGWPDLDHAMEQVAKNGAMLEELASCERYKQWALETFDAATGFEPVPALDLPTRMPFADMLKELERDLENGANGGLRHPNAFTLRVGAVIALVGEGEAQRAIPLIRRQACSKGRAIAARLYEQGKDYAQELVKGLLEYQGALRNLPDDWPTVEDYKRALSLGMKRYAGDNGLQENDFYNGDWIREQMSAELHQRNEALVEAQATAQAAEAIEAAPAALSAVGERVRGRAAAKAAGAQEDATPKQPKIR
jgi:hypothetical protein